MVVSSCSLVGLTCFAIITSPCWGSLLMLLILGLFCCICVNIFCLIFLALPFMILTQEREQGFLKSIGIEHPTI